MDGILKEDALNVTLVTMKFQDGFSDNIHIKAWTIAEYYDKIRYWQDKYTAYHGIMVDFKLWRISKLSREEFENLKPGMWITDGKHYFRITSQQDNEVTFFNMEEMDWDADNEEWIPLRTVNMNKYLLTRWEVFHPNEKTSDA